MITHQQRIKNNGSEKNNIYRHPNSQSWKVQWRDNQRTRKSKNFSDKRLGTELNLITKHGFLKDY